ncbi:Tuberous sclerosis 2-like protein, partial [Quaeritorhiza haematococci]
MEADMELENDQAVVATSEYPSASTSSHLSPAHSVSSTDAGLVPPTGRRRSSANSRDIRNVVGGAGGNGGVGVGSVHHLSLLSLSAASPYPYREQQHASIDPSFVMMQFVPYPEATAKPDPQPLTEDESTQRALKVLDRTPVVDLHKIGVVYVGPNQRTEAEILSNTHGSRSYAQFLHSLGNLVRLKGCREIYTGGLDTSDDLDGRYGIFWQDDLAQLIFH